MTLHAVRVRDYAHGVEAILIDHLGAYYGTTIALDGPTAVRVLVATANATGRLTSPATPADVQWVDDWATADPDIRAAYQSASAQ